jgi:hypothetical protein
MEAIHMMNRIKLASSIAVGLFAVLASSRDAHALGPVSVEVGAKAGLATNPADSGQPNPLGFGIGARGGIEIMNVYVGANVLYYFGSTQTLSTGLGSVDVSEHTLLYGLEGGYGFKFLDDLITLRPQLGIGNATYSVSGLGPLDGSRSNLYLEPGVTVLVGLGGLYVGGDANYLVFPSADQGGGQTKTWTSFTLHGQVGLKF